MEAICLDTHILIWGIQRKHGPGQEQLVTRAERYLDSLDPQKVSIIIPSIVVAEFLLGIPPDRHDATLALISSRFRVEPFDVMAAREFARIWHAKGSPEVIKKLIEKERATRQELRADCQIVATAAARKATYICSHDTKVLGRFASGVVNVRELPPILPRQQDLLIPEAPV